MSEKAKLILVMLIVLSVAVGLAFAGSQGGYAIANIPIYALCIAIAFIIQWIAFIPAFIKRTEKFYDLTGGITYITVIITALVLTPRVDIRSYILSGAIAIWAIRLGSFLFLRIRISGEDRRFREIKQSFLRFLLAWTLQGLWVSFSLAAALAAVTSNVHIDLDVFAFIGLILWLAGFAIEVIADRQKSQFKKQSENKGKFIHTGLWAWSRHPNYFGEIVLWIGVAVVAFPVLRGWQWVTLISPVFTITLLTRISGIPMLEEYADKKWGGQPDYEIYKAITPIIIPTPPKKGSRQIK